MFNYEEYYTELSPIYDKVRLDSKSDFDNTLKVICDNISQISKKILDIGCGTGRYGKALAERGYIVTGIDKSESQIKQAKKHINAFKMNTISMSFDDESFDVCTMIMMIHQMRMDERIIAFREIHRVLKKDGILIIKTCSHDDLSFRLTSKTFPKTLENDKNRYPQIDVLIEELGHFRKVNVKSTVVEFNVKKDEIYNGFEARRSSNLGMLSDEELAEGLKNFSRIYNDQSKIKKSAHNTFIVARK